VGFFAIVFVVNQIGVAFTIQQTSHEKEFHNHSQSIVRRSILSICFLYLKCRNSCWFVGV
jgi:hypothetical protein